MRITIVSPVFPPEPIVSAKTSSDVAQELAQKGHAVQVVTAFPNRPSGKLMAGYRRSLWSKEKHGPGLSVLRCFSFFSAQSSLPSRFLENISFGIASALAVLWMKKPDVLYANTWPIFAQSMLALVCRLRNIPVVLSIQDIYPESLYSQRRVSEQRSILTRLLRWLDLKTAQSSAAIIVIAERFRTIYVEDRQIEAEKVQVIPNWVDERDVEVGLKNNPIRSQHSIPEDAFLVVFAGNIGVAAGVEAVIRAFGDLGELEKVYLLIAGSGSQLAECQKLAQAAGNPRVVFHSPWLAAETSSVLAAGDVCILPTQGSQSTVSTPSKLITYMLAARPILACVEENSDIAATLRRADCGWIIPTDDQQALAQKVRALSELSPQALKSYGEHAQQYALTHMTRAVNLPRLIDLIEKIGEPVGTAKRNSLGSTPARSRQRS